LEYDVVRGITKPNTQRPSFLVEFKCTVLEKQYISIEGYTETVSSAGRELS
jgi:hypothetical protein